MTSAGGTGCRILHHLILKGIIAQLDISPKTAELLSFIERSLDFSIQNSHKIIKHYAENGGIIK